MRRNKITVMISVLLASTMLSACGGLKTFKSFIDLAQQIDDTEETETTIIEPTRGRVQDGVFINETFGIAFPITENMYVCPDEEILSAAGGEMSMLDENGYVSPEQMKEAFDSMIYDAIVVMSEQTENLSIIYCDYAERDTLFMDEEIFYSAYKISAEADSMLTDVKEYVTIGGREYLKFGLVGDGHIQNLYCRRQDNYMITIIYTCQEGIVSMEEEVMGSFIEVE